MGVMRKHTPYFSTLYPDGEPSTQTEGKPEASPQTPRPSDPATDAGVRSKAQLAARSNAKTAPASPPKRRSSGASTAGRWAHRTDQMRASMTRASVRLMTEQFVKEVKRVLSEQEAILPLLNTSRQWALQMLNRQYYAIRTASELLKQDNLATVAGRAEVLVSLLSRDVVTYRSEHLEILRDTWALLDEIATRVIQDGSDKHCFVTARTAVCLYATAEPTTQNYAPSKTRAQKNQPQVK